jgi:hypothetical protein
MLKADILRDGVHLGHLLIEGDTAMFEGDSAVKSLVYGAVRDGIPRWKEITLSDSKRIVEEAITKDDPHFDLALVVWLRREGYDVLEDHSEVDLAIEKLLGQLPAAEKWQKIKVETQKELPQANFLEKTYLLEKLREVFKENK